jgi:phage-related protein
VYNIANSILGVNCCVGGSLIKKQTICERILINVTTDNLSKRNVKLILKILSDLEPLRGSRSSNKKTLYSARGPFKCSFHSRFNLAHSYQKKTNLHTNLLNK